MNFQKTTNRIAFIASTLLLVSCGGETAENKTAAGVDCGTSAELSYKTDILPILQANCLGCHDEENYSKKSDGRLFEGYENFKKFVDKGTVVPAINHEPGLVKMPYRRPKLDSCSIVKIENWVKEGAKNN